MDEYKKDPTNLRTLAHLCDAVAINGKNYKTFEDVEKVYLEALEVARKKPNEPYANSPYVKSMVLYIINDKFGKAIEIGKEFLEKHDEISIANIAVYFLLTKAYMNLEDYENALESIKKYFEYMQKYRNNELTIVELRFMVLSGLTDSDYDEQLMSAARCENNLEHYDESLNYLEQIDLEDMAYSQLKVYLNIVRDLIRKTKNYDKLTEIYQKIVSMNDKDKDSMILYLMEQYYMEHPYERENFAKALSSSKINAPYIELMKIVKHENDGKDISDRLMKFIDSVDRWDDGYSEAIYLAMKHDLDITSAINKMSNKVLNETLQMISQAHLEFAEVALKYCQPEKFSDSIRKMLWMVTALENAVKNAQELLSDDKSELYDRFVAVLSDYILNIYNPDLLNPEDVEVLPELHRFGYYMNLAQASLYCGNDISYIRCLKEALRLCEPMKDLVSHYLTEFENSLKN